MGWGPPRQSAAQIEKIEKTEELLAEIYRIVRRPTSIRRRLPSGEPGQYVLQPIPLALAWLALYALLWMAAAAFGLIVGVPHEPRLTGLLAWGGCYFAAALLLAQRLTLRIGEIVERDIVPYASTPYLTAVIADLKTAHRPSFHRQVPFLAGAVVFGFAFLAIHADIWRGGRLPPSPQLMLWGLTYFVYFAAAARTVLAARFYLSFARHLILEQDSFYVLAASESALVRGLIKLGGEVLAFWALIFLAVLSIMTLVFVPDPYRFEAMSWTLAFLIPVAGSFSFGYGAIVYLESERRIRGELRRFAQKQAAVLQDKANAILDPVRRRIPGDAATLQRLTDWHDRILAGGHYGGRLKAGVSILLPFIPLAGLLQTLYLWWTGAQP